MARPSKLYEFQKTFRRHRVGFAATAAVIVVLFAGVLVSTWQAVRATHAKQEALAAQSSETKLRKRTQAEELPPHSLVMATPSPRMAAAVC